MAIINYWKLRCNGFPSKTVQDTVIKNNLGGFMKIYDKKCKIIFYMLFGKTKIKLTL